MRRQESREKHMHLVVSWIGTLVERMPIYMLIINPDDSFFTVLDCFSY